MFAIEFSRAAVRHLNDLRAYERATVVDAIEEQLQHQPGVETRRRKKLRPNEFAGWELRVGEVRVLYDIEEEADEAESAEQTGVVVVLAIGIKDGDRLIIDGEELEL